MYWTKGMGHESRLSHCCRNSQHMLFFKAPFPSLSRTSSPLHNCTNHKTLQLDSSLSTHKHFATFWAFAGLNRFKRSRVMLPSLTLYPAAGCRRFDKGANEAADRASYLFMCTYVCLSGVSISFLHVESHVLPSSLSLCSTPARR